MDVLPIMGLFLIVTSIILAVVFFILHDITLAIALTNVIMLIVINFEILSNIFNIFLHKYICTITVACVCILALTIFLKKKNIAASLNLVIFISFFSLIIINFVPTIPIIIRKVFTEVKKSDILASIDYSSLDTEERPNIYYLIFDEYGGRRNLEKYFGYDNHEFLEFLSDSGFSVSDTSKNEESLDTTVLVPNLLNIDYIVDESMIKEEKLACMNEPALFKIMQSLDYDIVTCSCWHFLDNSMSIKNFEKENLFEDKAGYFVLKNSAFIYLYEKYIEDQALGPEVNLSMVNALQYYKELPSTSREEIPQICVGYFQAPHGPFYYRSDGTLNPPEEHYNWLENDNYVEYLKWINGNIQEIVKAIIDNDRDSIIIIQSDHGARYPIHVEELTGENPFSVEDCSYQHYTLNCLYYKGEKKDIEGLSGLNTLRFVLNEEFNTNLEMIFYDDNL